MIRVALPSHLRTLAEVAGEVTLEVQGPVTQRSVLDALELRYPMLRGTIRDYATGERRAFLRFFACEEDLSFEPPDAPLQDAVVAGREPFLVIGAVAGGVGERCRWYSTGMEIRLSPELEAAVERGVASGRYASAEEYVAEAVELLQEQDAWRNDSLEEQRAKMEVSLAEAERGEVAGEQQVREEMRAMKGEWISQRQAS